MGVRCDVMVHFCWLCDKLHGCLSIWMFGRSVMYSSMDVVVNELHIFLSIYL